jgi:hypothetical protein
MRAFALGAQIVFNQPIQLWERAMVLFKRAVLWIRALECLRQDPDSRLEIFLRVGWERRSELVIEVSEEHNGVLIQNFFVP